MSLLSQPTHGRANGYRLWAAWVIDGAAATPMFDRGAGHSHERLVNVLDFSGRITEPPKRARLYRPGRAGRRAQDVGRWGRQCSGASRSRWPWTPPLLRAGLVMRAPLGPATWKVWGP